MLRKITLTIIIITALSLGLTRKAHANIAEYDTDYPTSWEVEENYENNEEFPLVFFPFVAAFPLLIFALVCGSWLLWFVVIVISIINLIDCSDRDFENKTLWMVLLSVGLLMWMVGVVANVLYYVVVRNKNLGGKQGVKSSSKVKDGPVS